jgi:hypothetical protein
VRGCTYLQPPRLPFHFHALPQTSLTALFLAHPSPSLLIPFLPAPSADAPCLADQRWHDVTVLLHSVLLLFPLLLTVFSKNMKTMRPKTSIILIFPPPLLLPDRVTLKRTAALYCTAHACRVMLTSSSNHLHMKRPVLSAVLKNIHFYRRRQCSHGVAFSRRQPPPRTPPSWNGGSCSCWGFGKKGNKEEKVAIVILHAKCRHPITVLTSHSKRALPPLHAASPSGSVECVRTPVLVVQPILRSSTHLSRATTPSCQSLSVFRSKRSFQRVLRTRAPCTPTLHMRHFV